MWKNCESILDTLALERQERIDSIIEECSQQKFESIAHLKAGYDLQIKWLTLCNLKAKAEAKKKDKEEAIKKVQAQMTAMKLEKIRAVNAEFQERKKLLMDKQIKETQSKLKMSMSSDNEETEEASSSNLMLN